ncbi:MAG: hypothetical protein D6813_10740 [Calditrichaeota bacterium]|nr:MAG: hypothetical protein D6813_10740 [Calditrichota bacterium]
MTYFRVSCLVAKNYQNTMEEKGWSMEQIQAMCQEAENEAVEAYQQGVKAYPVFEPYRLLIIKKNNSE